MKVSSLSAQVGFKLLQLGESGAGKTKRALEATRFGRVCVIDIDNKLRAFCATDPKRYNDDIIDCASTSSYGKDRPVQSITDLDIFLKQLTTLPTLPFETLVFDTFSEFQDAVERHHAALNKKTPLEFSFPDWRAVKDLNLSTINRLIALPCNIIINGHLKKDKNVFDQMELVPGFTGKAGDEVVRKFDEIHFLRCANKKHVAFGKPQPGMSVVKTLCATTLLDEAGAFKANDFSIFDTIAYRGSTK